MSRLKKEPEEKRGEASGGATRSEAARVQEAVRPGEENSHQGHARCLGIHLSMWMLNRTQDSTQKLKVAALGNIDEQKCGGPHQGKKRTVRTTTETERAAQHSESGRARRAA